MIKRTQNIPSFFSSLDDLLNQQHPLYKLSHKINWQVLENSFTPLYCSDNGRPVKPIRLMCGLLILKHLRNISDESVVEQWSENAYFQYFCGMQEFVPNFPCTASELVHFLFEKLLLQRRNSSQKIYSIHEPDVQCISKGKEHKKYEFGNKVSIILIHCQSDFRNEGLSKGRLNSFVHN